MISKDVKLQITISSNFKLFQITAPSSLIQLLLLLSGIELNPGSGKYPCGNCSESVRYEKSIICDAWVIWYRKKCLEMNSVPYDGHLDNIKLEWELCNCVFKNVSPSTFNDPITSDILVTFINHKWHTSMSPSSSPITSFSPKPTPNKAEQWKLLIINFKSNWGKKEELELSLIDISFRSEIHLDPSLSDSDFILANCKAFL